jgi:hypothetical protein
MAGEVLVDALPYIDSGYEEPGVKQTVNLFFPVALTHLY